MRPDAPVQGDLIAGKYRVRSVLGRGRGTLVLADHTAFEQRVAIRIVTPSMSEPVEIAKFRREAKVLAKLGSEHVARILDVGLLIDGSSYLVRQYLEGKGLTDYIRERRMLPVDEAIGLILQATEAVAESHAYGVLVRELSPEHLFLAERSPGVRGGPRILKITDFGTAKLMRDARPNAPEDYTATTVLGLSPYASPEMLRRQRDVDLRTDIWSLAAILYEMLTGSAPFGKDPISLAVTISRDEPPPFDRFRRDVPREVEAAVRQALSKDKNARPADTHAFAASLVRFAPDDARHLMARIRDLAQSARARSGQADDDEEEISLEEASELDDPPTDEVASFDDSSSSGEIEPETRVGRPQDIVRGLPPPPQAEQPRARRPLQEKTEALGVTFVPGDPYRRSNHAFAGAAAGLEPSSPARASTPAPAPNLGRSPSQPGFPRIVPPAVASHRGARGSSPPPAPEATQLGFGNVAAAPFAQPTLPPAAPPQGAYQPVAGSAWMTSPGLAVPQVQPSEISNGRKIAMFAIGGALAALLILVVVVLALPAPPVTSSSPSGESVVVKPATETAGAAQTAQALPLASAAQATADSAPPETATATQSAAPSATTATVSTAKPIAKPTGTASSVASATASAPKGDTGTLVVVVVGGTCTITVNGAFKGTTNSLKLSVAPGSYAVSCKPSTGQAKSNTVAVKADQSAMAMFNLN